MKKSLCVIRDQWLNPWDAGTYYGLCDKVNLVYAYRGQPPQLLEMLELYPKAKFWDYTGGTQHILDAEFDVLDVPDMFYDFSQHFAARHPRVIHVAWDNLPGNAVGIDCSNVWKHVARTVLIAHRLLLDGIREVSVIPAAVDTNMFQPIPLEDRLDAVAFVGRGVPEKGLEHALWAMNGFDTQLWIVGQEATEWQGKWLNYAKGVNVTYWHYQGRHAMASILSEAKALIFPSMPRPGGSPDKAWLEQFGQVLIEAMACGTPVVAYNQGSNEEILGPGDYAPCGNWLQLRGKLVRLLQDSYSWQGMSEFYRNRAVNAFSQEVVADLIMEQYEL